MQNGRRILAPLVALSFLAACSKSDATADSTQPASAPAATDHTADAAAILQLDSAWLRNVMAKNVDSVMTYYLPGALSYQAGSAPAEGTDQLRASYVEMAKATVNSGKLNTNTVKFSDDGSVAYDHGTYTMTMTPPGGKPATMDGAYLNVWRRTDNGWKMDVEMSTPIAVKK
jgi:uncharacterized protein (TIGR02246 family)